jgi:hypothetical protein
MPFESLLVLSVTCCVVAEHNAVVSFFFLSFFLSFFSFFSFLFFIYFFLSFFLSFFYAISEPFDTVIVTCAILELVDILAVTGYALSELISILCVICAY